MSACVIVRDTEEGAQAELERIARDLAPLLDRSLVAS